MQRYPEPDLIGEIVSAERHRTIPTVTVLHVRTTSSAPGSMTRVYVFEQMMSIEEMQGRCLRADVLPLPQNDHRSDESGTLIAMEWCVHEKDGRTVECSPGWSGDEKGRTYIRLTPPQI